MGEFIKKWGRHLFGVLLLLGVVFIWVAGSELMQYVFLEENFSKPFFLTYCSTSTLSVYLLISVLKRLFIKCRQSFFPSGSSARSPPGNPEEFQILVANPSDDDEDDAGSVNDANGEFDIDLSTIPLDDSELGNQLENGDTRKSPNGIHQDDESSESLLNNGGAGSHDIGLVPLTRETIEKDQAVKSKAPKMGPSRNASAPMDQDPAIVRLSVKQVSFLSLQFCFLWFLANYSTNAALIYTSVSSSTILNSTSGFFTLLIGSLVGVETITFSKLLAVAVSLSGVALVSISDGSGDDHESVYGDLISIFGAVMYGCYTVFLKKKIEHEDRVDMLVFFGFVGLFNILLLWPFFFILNATGVEPFELPSKKVMGELILNGLIGTCLSDYLWLLSMLMTSPVVVTLGLSLTIPLAMGADSFQGKFEASPSYWAGTVLVLSAFLVINLGGYFAKFDAAASRYWQRFLRKIRCGR